MIKGDDGQIRGTVLGITTNGKPKTLHIPITRFVPT